MMDVMWKEERLDTIIRAWADQYAIKGKTIVNYHWFIDTQKGAVIFNFYVVDAKPAAERDVVSPPP